jgi:hypothetical protein
LIRILAHRGHWTSPEEKNSKAALRRAFEGGFGIETDIRDHAGRVVIAHDKPNGTEMSLGQFLDLMAAVPQAGAAGPLALNVKADGLAGDVAAALRGLPRSAWFVFDMSVPDMLSYLKAGLPAFTRISDLETEPVALAQCDGIWVDGFLRDWTDFQQLHRFLDEDKMIAVVSPELHGRRHGEFWRRFRDGGFGQRSGVMLCTDFPLEAQAFFRG